MNAAYNMFSPVNIFVYKNLPISFLKLRITGKSVVRHSFSSVVIRTQRTATILMPSFRTSHHLQTEVHFRLAKPIISAQLPPYEIRQLRNERHWLCFKDVVEEKCQVFPTQQQRKKKCAQSDTSEGSNVATHEAGYTAAKQPSRTLTKFTANQGQKFTKFTGQCSTNPCCLVSETSKRGNYRVVCQPLCLL